MVMSEYSQYRRYDRIVAIIATSAFFLLAAIFCFLAMFTYKRDSERVIEYVKHYQEEALLQNNI